MKLTTKILAIVLAVFTLSQQAAAGPLYTLKAYPGKPPSIGDMTSASPGLEWSGSAARPGPGQLVEGDWALGADQGLLRSSVSATATGVFGTPNVFVTSSEFSYDDLFFTGPAGTPFSISVALNMHLSGTLKEGLTDDGFGSVLVDMIFISHPFSGGVQHTSGTVTGAGFSGGILSGLGAGGTIDDDLSIAFGATVSPTYAHTLTVKLITQAHGGDGAFGDGIASAFSDFGNSLHFATDGPVFDLPEGVTVNSVQAGIVDNQFIISEPSTLALAALGLSFIAMRRKR